MKKAILGIILIFIVSIIATFYISSVEPPITGLDTFQIITFKTTVIKKLPGGGGGSSGAAGGTRSCDDYPRKYPYDEFYYKLCWDKGKTEIDKPDVEEAPIEEFEPPIQIEEQYPAVITTIESDRFRYHELALILAILIIFCIVIYLMMRSQPKKKKH